MSHRVWHPKFQVFPSPDPAHRFGAKTGGTAVQVRGGAQLVPSFRAVWDRTQAGFALERHPCRLPVDGVACFSGFLLSEADHVILQGLPHAAQASMRDYRTQLEAKGVRHSEIRMCCASFCEPLLNECALLYFLETLNDSRSCSCSCSEALDKPACVELVAIALPVLLHPAGSCGKAMSL